MKKTNKMKKWSCTIVEGAGSPSELCPCGCGYAKGCCVRKMQRPKVFTQIEKQSLVLAGDGEPLNM